MNRLNDLRMNWRLLFTPTADAASTLDATAQTKLSWAKPIESYAAVPDAYQAFFEPLRVDGLALPYTLITPTFEGFLRRATEKLVCELEHEIYILKKGATALRHGVIPLRLSVTLKSELSCWTPASKSAV